MAYAAVCVLTHDPKFDIPLLEVALRTPAGHIGAMGSRRTHDDRLAPQWRVSWRGAVLARAGGLRVGEAGWWSAR
jgi:xanthine dehydrogenase accessory factor